MKITALAIAFLGLACGHEVREKAPAHKPRHHEEGGKPRHHQNKAVRGADHRPQVEGKKICGDMDLRNAQCYKDTEPELYDAAKAVIYIRIFMTPWTYKTCTGFLVGPNNYMMTNEHCISDQNDADKSEFYFMYESATGSCEVGGVADDDANTSDMIAGGELVWVSKELDAALIKLAGDPAMEFEYYDISSDPPTVGSHIYVPQHPKGRDKSIGITDSYTASGMCEIDRYADAYTSGYPHPLGYENIVYTCDTQSGSSGSPVVDKNEFYTVVGLNKAEYTASDCHGALATPMNLIYPYVADIVY